MVQQGWALVTQDQDEAGLAQMQQGFDTVFATGAEIFRPNFLTLMADAYGKVGRIDEGLDLLVEALDTVQVHDARFMEAEIYRIKGEMLWHQTATDTSEAEACLHHAIEVARHQQAKSLELRATISLCRLWQQQK